MERAGKSIMVAGASGFLGSYLVRNALHAGMRVRLLLRPGSDTWRIRDLLPDCELLEWRGEFDSELAAQIRRLAPESWIHLAWKGVENAARNDSSQIFENVQQVNSSLLLARDCGCKHYVGIGSQAEYGVKTGRISETDSTAPTTAYGKAKLASRWLTDAFCEVNGMACSWLRVFSTYGPMDNGGWFIPYLIRELDSGRAPEVTACSQIWDYLYVNDAARAIQAVVEREAAGVFNIASGIPIRLRDVVEEIQEQMGKTQAVQFGKRPFRPDQVMHLEGNISKLSTASGWHPEEKLASGIQKTIEYYTRDSAK
jgi:UDP-glucose 4-epimerase